MLVKNLCKKFYEIISKIIFDQNVDQLNTVSRDFISNKIIADIKMLSVIILNEILLCFYSISAIHINKNRCRRIEAIELETDKKLS